MKTISILTAVLVATLAPTAAMAEGGFVLAGSVGSADLSDDFDGFNVDANSTAYRLTLSWQFNEYFALDAGYHNFGDFDQIFDIPGMPTEISLSADGFTLGATGTLPLGDRWMLFARAGAFFWDGNASINNVTAATPADSNLYLGVGAGFNMTKKLSLTIDGSRYDLDGTSSTVLSAGLKYAF
ncbi:MAG: porin family protein [Woeseiaceae bacterium]